MPVFLQAALATTLWCVLHSAFVSHRWRRFVQGSLPSYRPWQRLAYVAASTASFGLLVLWLRTLPEVVVWDWTGLWRWVRWLGLLEACVLFVLGMRAYEGRAFLGLQQAADHLAGRTPREPAFRSDGILAVIRHPWYAGTLLLLAFGLPVTDVNLAWRLVLAGYVLVGTELEERKLLADLGPVYAEYRKRVGRFLPRAGRARH